MGARWRSPPLHDPKNAAHPLLLSTSLLPFGEVGKALRRGSHVLDSASVIAPLYDDFGPDLAVLDINAGIDSTSRTKVIS
jgi:hypothetical protein